VTAQPYQVQAYQVAQPNGQPYPVPQQPTGQGLSFLIHGPAKAGKSTVGVSGPAPGFVLDVEGSAYWTPTRKVYWNPLRETVPSPGRHLTAGYGQPSVTPSWESAIVLVREARTVSETYRILASGQHPFNSGTMDSVSEVQQRVIDDLAGTRQMQRENWGALLRQVSSMVRMYRDLITHPVKPLWSMCFIAGTHFDGRTGKWRPLVQGQAQDFLPYYVDILGYLGANADNSRHLLIGPHPQYETGERVGGRLPYSMQIGYPGRPGYTLESMIRQVLAGGTQ
jgi:AAA domain